MRSLLLHPTSTAQWQGLIHEAQQSLSIHLHVEMEAYLVFLLMRFAEQPEMARSVLGLDFLEGTQQLQCNQAQHLKNVGDKCLLFAGLFPEHTQSRRVSPQYFVSLGKSAYLNLAEHISLVNQAALFVQLYQEFLLLTDVLQATRDISQPCNDLIMQVERWYETGSPLAWQQLQQRTSSLPAPEAASKGKKKSSH